MSKITKEDMRVAVPGGALAVKIDRAMFDSAEGEVFAGLNILKLKVGEADGPFVFKLLTPPRFLNAKYKDPIQTGVCVRCDMQGKVSGSAQDVQLPASASMGQKIFDAKLAPGDVFAIAREADYTSKQGRDDCNAYIVKVFTRSGEPAVKKATLDEFKAAKRPSAAKKEKR